MVSSLELKAVLLRMAASLLVVGGAVAILLCQSGGDGPEILLKHSEPAGKGAEYVPIHKWQIERVAKLRMESLEETIENLPNIVDVHLAETSVEGETWDGPYQNQVVVNLARVRRILEEGYKDKETVTILLEIKLAEVLEDWDRAFAVFRNAVTHEAGWEDEWRVVDDYRLKAMGTIYSLAELSATEALPLLVKAFRKFRPDTTMMPVAPALATGAIQRLMVTYPKDRLSPEAQQAHEDYTQKAQILMSPPEMRPVTRWYADYDDSDPRFRMFPEVKPILLQTQPGMRVRVYPSRFSDNTEIGDWQGIPDPRAVELVDLVEKFLQAAETPSPWSL